MRLDTVHGEKDIDLSLPYYEMGTYNKYPHWGWWIFWLILFWPIMIILLVVGLSRKHYIIAVGKEMEKYEMTEEQFKFYKAYKECYDDFNTSEEEV